MATDDTTKRETSQGETEEIKVNDRRLFSRDGQLREALPDVDEVTDGEVSEESKAEPASVDPTPEQDPGFAHRPIEEPEGVDFTMLINAMAQPALIFLGEVPHPGTGKPEVNLDQARLQIDLLDTLRIKTRGNLSAPEEGLLDRMLYQLRMLYVARSGQSGS